MREDDCFASRGENIRGMEVTDIMSGQQKIESLEDRIIGRFTAEDVIDPNTGEVLVQQNVMISDARTPSALPPRASTEVRIRTVLTCRNDVGVCCALLRRVHGHRQAG